jgi:hypothetical protein
MCTDSLEECTTSILKVHQVKQAELCLLLACLAYFSSLKMEAICSSEMSINFYRLHGVASKKIVPSITSYFKESSCHMRTDRHGEANRYILATFYCEYGKKVKLYIKYGEEST